MGEVPTLDELVARVDAVTADDVARVIDRVLRGRTAHARRRRPARRRPTSPLSVAETLAGGVAALALEPDDPGRGVRRRRAHGRDRLRRGRSTRRDLELVAAVDPHHAGIDLQQLGVRHRAPVCGERRARWSTPAPRSRVDFTVIDAARENLRWCAATRRARGRRHDRVHRRRARRARRALRRRRRPTRSSRRTSRSARCS